MCRARKVTLFYTVLRELYLLQHCTHQHRMRAYFLVCLFYLARSIHFVIYRNTHMINCKSASLYEISDVGNSVIIRAFCTKMPLTVLYL
jgi:hypothetical protein